MACVNVLQFLKAFSYEAHKDVSQTLTMFMPGTRNIHQYFKVMERFGDESGMADVARITRHNARLSATEPAAKQYITETIKNMETITEIFQTVTILVDKGLLPEEQVNAFDEAMSVFTYQMREIAATTMSFSEINEKMHLVKQGMQNFLNVIQTNRRVKKVTSARLRAKYAWNVTKWMSSFLLYATSVTLIWGQGFQDLMFFQKTVSELIINVLKLDLEHARSMINVLTEWGAKWLLGLAQVSSKMINDGFATMTLVALFSKRVAMSGWTLGSTSWSTMVTFLRSVNEIIVDRPRFEETTDLFALGSMLGRIGGSVEVLFSMFTHPGRSVEALIGGLALYVSERTLTLGLLVIVPVCQIASSFTLALRYISNPATSLVVMIADQNSSRNIALQLQQYRRQHPEHQLGHEAKRARRHLRRARRHLGH